MIINIIIDELAGINWGCNANTLRTSDKIGVQLNAAMRTETVRALQLMATCSFTYTPPPQNYEDKSFPKYHQYN